MGRSAVDQYSDEQERDDPGKASSLSEKSGDVQHSEVHRTALRKLDTRVLPVVIVMLFLSSLDRNNIGNARIAGLQATLGLSNSQVNYLSVRLYMMLTSVLQYSMALTVNSMFVSISSLLLETS